MKATKQFMEFMRYNPSLAAFLARHASPENEASLAKGIPVRDRWVAHILSGHLPVRIKYRGPRRKNPRTGTQSFQGKSMCLKADAVTFAIYLR